MSNNHLSLLTNQQIHVLELLAKGHNSQQIADELNIRKRTVDYHLQEIYIRLEVNNAISALRKCWELGVIINDPWIDNK